MTPWDRAARAWQLLQINPKGLGGIALRARSGPVRDAFIAALPPDRVRLHPALSAEALHGGVDVSASLHEGTLIRTRGPLDQPEKLLLLSLAERITPLFAAKLCQALDEGLSQGLVALDEGIEADETLPTALQDRLAFHVDLDGLSRHEIAEIPQIDRDRAQELFPHVTASDTALEELVALSVTLGITSLRAPSLALHAARANAALNNRKTLSEDDILTAAELVLAPRATRLPVPEETTPEPPADRPEGEGTSDPDPIALPQEILLEAIKTALPADLLTESHKTAKNGTGSGAGAKQIGNRRGRPLPARNATRKGGQPRVDLMATLRAAVPWQTLRKGQYSARTGPIILPPDLRYKRYEDLSDRLLIFAVDASGSAALARLAEAKGAVELLLADAYARRDHVALISFRGDNAEVLLPPTRSLVQTKRRLADLPGGGGTPLAQALKVGLETSETSWRKGLSPVLIVLTDGRSNIALDGTPNRKQAAEDVQAMARLIATTGLETIVIDTSRRPEHSLRALATSLGGRYLSLPRADAQKLSAAVSDALTD